MDEPLGPISEIQKAMSVDVLEEVAAIWLEHYDYTVW
jgi:hypothetical protein